MTPLQILLALAPCYQESARINTLITLASGKTSLEKYGSNWAEAVALLVLHELALEERGKGGASGAIVSEAEGDLSRSYAAPQASGAQGLGSDDLSSTSWGQRLSRLRKGSYIPGGITRLG